MNERLTAESLKVGEGEWLEEIHARGFQSQPSAEHAQALFCNRGNVSLPAIPYYEECVSELTRALGGPDHYTGLATSPGAEIQARLDRKDRANEALVQRVLAQDAKIEAMMSDMRSLQAAAESMRVERDLLFDEAKRLQDICIGQAVELARLKPVEPVKENPLHRAIRQSA